MYKIYTRHQFTRHVQDTYTTCTRYLHDINVHNMYTHTHTRHVYIRHMYTYAHTDRKHTHDKHTYDKHTNDKHTHTTVTSTHTTRTQVRAEVWTIELVKIDDLSSIKTMFENAIDTFTINVRLSECMHCVCYFLRQPHDICVRHDINTHINDTYTTYTLAMLTTCAQHEHDM
jgi:hypothetical protein